MNFLKALMNCIVVALELYILGIIQRYSTLIRLLDFCMKVWYNHVNGRIPSDGSETYIRATRCYAVDAGSHRRIGFYIGYK